MIERKEYLDLLKRFKQVVDANNELVAELEIKKEQLANADDIIEQLIEEKTGINTMTAEEPMKVVAIGTGQFVEFMNGRKDF